MAQAEFTLRAYRDVQLADLIENESPTSAAGGTVRNRIAPNDVVRRRMGLGVSLVLVAAGAILVWGVTDEPSGLDLDAIRVILMVIGIVGFVLSMLMWRSWWGPGYFTRSTYVEAPLRPHMPDNLHRRRAAAAARRPPPPP